MIYQIFGIFIGIFAIILSIVRFKEGKMSFGMLSLWIAIWIMVIGTSISPESTTWFANIVGIKRGLDFLLVLGLIGCYYLIFRIYIMMENIEREITEVVREIALRRDDLEHENRRSEKQNIPLKSMKENNKK